MLLVLPSAMLMLCSNSLMPIQQHEQVVPEQHQELLSYPIWFVSGEPASKVKSEEEQSRYIRGTGTSFENRVYCYSHNITACSDKFSISDPGACCAFLLKGALPDSTVDSQQLGLIAVGMPLMTFVTIAAVQLVCGHGVDKSKRELTVVFVGWYLAIALTVLLTVRDVQHSRVCL
jgi:hypothetical protein